MTYQLLVSTMNQTDDSILDEMRIQSDAIIINQCDHVAKRTLSKNGKTIQFYSFDERGIGLSRNTAFMRATADIVEFADDDMILSPTYEQDVLREFEAHPEADVILFSIESLNPERPLLKIDEFARVGIREALKYGCARLAVRREKLLYHNLSLSLLFGGGAKYGSGEDTVFLQELLHAGLHIYKSPIKVADVKQTQSSWFDGFTEKYYADKGALFAAAMPGFCYIYAILTAMKNHRRPDSAKKVLPLYFQGIRQFKEKQKGGRNN